MKMTISDAYGLNDVLEAFSQGREVYAPEADGHGHYRLVRAPTWLPGRHTLGAYRQTEPLKVLFFQPREFLGTFTAEADREPIPERIVFGVKNCDLSSLQIHDHVFLNGGGCKDPYYAAAREKTILVSSDCDDFLDVCFCAGVGEQPYALKGFDINISSTPAGVLFEVETDRGADLLRATARYLKPANPALLDAVRTQRKQKHETLAVHSEKHGVKPGADLRHALEDSFGSTLWQDFAADCVECGACNFICCTCHCFLLADGVNADSEPARTKQWDACLLRNFAATAGGHNARPLRTQRLHHRFDKKFSYFPKVLGRYACDGCGRCTEACIAKIDIRDVLRRAIDESDALHAHSGDC